MLLIYQILQIVRKYIILIQEYNIKDKLYKINIVQIHKILKDKVEVFYY